MGPLDVLARKDQFFAGELVRRWVALKPKRSGRYISSTLAAGAVTPEAKLQAFRNAGCWMSGIFLLGLVALPFLPETKGRPLPEDSP